MKGFLRPVLASSPGIRFVTVLGLALLMSACSGGGGASSNADLDDLSIGVGSLDQVFQSEQTSYTAMARFLVASLGVIAKADDDGATIRIEGETVDSGKPHRVNLAEGDNAIEIEVTAADGATTRTYDLVITRRTLAEFAQRAYVKASNTSAGDRFGHSVSLSGNTLVVGASGENSSATGVSSDGSGEHQTGAANAGAVYVFTRAGTGSWSQQAYIKASNTDPEDRFGESVALDGDTLVVGASGEDSQAKGVNYDQDDVGQDNNSYDDSGAVYVFTRDDTGTWSQQAYIKASNTDLDDRFGSSIALDGDILAVGADGEASNATGVNGNEQNNSAKGGMPGSSGAGAVYVFARDGNAWSQEAYIKASNSNWADWFGSSVALSGSTLAVGAIGEGSSATGVNGNEANDDARGAGAVYVFTRDGKGDWSQQAYIKASNTGSRDQFGHSVALSGDTLAVGARKEGSNATGVNGDEADNSAGNSGAVYLFTRDGTGGWSQQAYIKASNTDPSDGFGWSLALAGDTLAVGAVKEGSNATGLNGNEVNDNANDAGAVYVFTRDDTGAWSQQVYVKASNTGEDDHFGYSVALDGDTLAVGAEAESGNGTGEGDDSAVDAGAVYLHR